VRNQLLGFNNEFGISGSDFESKLKSMMYFDSYKLNLYYGTVEIYFLEEKPDPKLKATILLALNQFCNLYPASYDSLKIFISLDDLSRDLSQESQKQSWDKILRACAQKSQAFTVSGVTMPSEKIIVLTKKQEIIKLMFHELVHFVGLDSCFASMHLEVDWSLKNQTLNPREAYTEFVAVILNAAFKASLSPNGFNTFIDILELEITHSAFATHNLLKFYEISSENFFSNRYGKHKLECPIQIWEYVFLRTNLLLNLNKVIRYIDERFYCRDPKSILNLMVDYGKILEFDFQMDFVPNLSYLLLDWLDWLEYSA
jgi:hypothetical protein